MRLMIAMASLGRFCQLTYGFGSYRNLKQSTQFRMLISTMFSSSQSSDNRSVIDPLIVCGPSGVGKGTIINKVMTEFTLDKEFGFTVSHTTRKPREGEIDGVHYHFVEMDDMKNGIGQGNFLEYAEVHGNYYGTSWSSLRDVQAKGKRCLLDIDVQGVKLIKSAASKEMLQPKYVFIAPPSFEVLKERLIGRGSETAETIARRTGNAKKELEYGTLDNFDAIVVNNDLDLACQDFLHTVKQLYGIQL